MRSTWRPSTHAVETISMTSRLMVATLGLSAVLASPRLSAQLVSYKDAPVRISHYHLNVTSIEAQKKFWVETLGGSAATFGQDKLDVIKLPDVLVFLHAQK